MKAGFTQLIRLKKPDIAAAIETMVRAFRNYSLFTYFYPDMEERERRMPATFRCSIRRCLLYGEAYAISPYMEGVVLWLPSSKVAMTPWQTLRCGKVSLALTERPEVRRKTVSFNEYAVPMHRRLMPQEHMYLWILSVDPAFQGEGLTTRMLAPMLERLDRRGLPCFVETHAEENVPIYRHFGFEVLDESLLPGTQIGHWALARKPHRLSFRT